jgi:predicted unusual protein kinase regulating ubiquinone biosynthesis (AarF/ABC1/UbiB family)
LIDLEALSPVEDMGPVRRSIQYMLDNFMERSFEEQSIDEIIDDLYEISYGRPFRFPATFTFVMRAFSTLQSVGQGLDPNFNFMTVAQPFAMELMNDTGPSAQNGLLSELSRQAFQVSNTALALPRRIEDTLEKLERGDIRVRVRSTETDRILRRLGNVNMGTNYTLLVGTFTLSATVLVVNGMVWLAVMAALAALVSAIALIRVLLRLDRHEKNL